MYRIIFCFLIAFNLQAADDFTFKRVSQKHGLEGSHRLWEEMQDEKIGLEDFKKRFQQASHQKYQLYNVVNKDGKAVAFFGYTYPVSMSEGKELNIDILYVGKEARRKGVSKKIYAFLSERAKEKGIKTSWAVPEGERMKHKFCEYKLEMKKTDVVFKSKD